MKTLGKLILVSAACAVASPAIACNMHGDGMFWSHGNHWQNFTPKFTSVDPLFDSEEEGDLFDMENMTFETAPMPRKVRPTFSSAATNASRAAKTRVMMMDKSATKADIETVASVDTPEPDDLTREASSDTNTQAIR